MVTVMHDAGSLAVRELEPPVTVETLRMYIEVAIVLFDAGCAEPSRAREWVPRGATVEDLRGRVRRAFCVEEDRPMWISVFASGEVRSQRKRRIPEGEMRVAVLPCQVGMSPAEVAEEMRTQEGNRGGEDMEIEERPEGIADDRISRVRGG
jgi:hypothetical protein